MAEAQDRHELLAVTISENLAERVHDLLERNAVTLVVGYENRAAVVNGGHGWYVIRCTTDGVSCDCLAGSTGAQCAHALAAMAVWGEALDDPFSGVNDAEKAAWPRQDLSR